MDAASNVIDRCAEGMDGRTDVVICCGGVQTTSSTAALSTTTPGSEAPVRGGGVHRSSNRTNTRDGDPAAFNGRPRIAGLSQVRLLISHIGFSRMERKQCVDSFLFVHCLQL